MFARGGCNYRAASQGAVRGLGRLSLARSGGTAIRMEPTLATAGAFRIQEPIVELRNVRVHDRRSRNYPRAFEVADCDRVHHLSQHDCRREEWRPLLKAAEIRHAARPGACTWTPNQRDPLVFWCSAPWRLWLLLRHQLRQGRPAANAKLVIGIAEMKLDSLWTQVQLGGHLACRPAAGE